MLDMRGAEWSGEGRYTLQPTACRFEQYEISFATKVANCTHPGNRVTCWSVWCSFKPTHSVYDQVGATTICTHA